jgi:FkbH-like protein
VLQDTITVRMRISEALKVIQAAPRDAEPFRVALVCGYTPLHLQTFLAAHLQLAHPQRSVTVVPSLYGDIAGGLENLANQATDAVCLSLEWEDLDPRLGFRGSGRWGTEAVEDILVNLPSALRRLTVAVSRIPAGVPVVIAPPSIPLPPLFHTPGFRSSVAELALQQHIAEFQLHLAAEARVAVISSQRLAEDSPGGSRYDMKSDLAVGLPYSLEHAEVLASLLAKNLAPPTPKKGIITDLDDTLWSGIVGEGGPETVTWELASHSHLHGLYQKLLASLASEGVLVAIASKNDPAVVERALQRKDLLLNPNLVFPAEVHWSAKSGSVARILKTWNIAADNVVFVDDSPMELAEVAAAHPAIETVLFPTSDATRGLQMLRRLRDLCGKGQLSQDDRIRRDSIKRGVQFRNELASAETAPEWFWQQLNSILTLDFDCADSARAYELVNKTNQFNLNGIRYTEPEWRRLVSGKDSVLVLAGYDDRFGPLGVISVLEGEVSGSRLVVNTWVLSCRAFGRRIEHAILQLLFDRSNLKEVEFNFIATARNRPLQDFLTGILGGKPACQVVLSREQFDRNCPRLYHEIRELRGAEATVR